ncbi:hypothetical protein ACFIJ5_08560 [Haloimpatiens sp. FM7330]
MNKKITICILLIFLVSFLGFTTGCTNEKLNSTSKDPKIEEKS